MSTYPPKNKIFNGVFFNSEGQEVTLTLHGAKALRIARKISLDYSINWLQTNVWSRNVGKCSLRVYKKAKKDRWSTDNDEAMYSQENERYFRNSVKHWRNVFKVNDYNQAVDQIKKVFHEWNITDKVPSTFWNILETPIPYLLNEVEKYKLPSEPDGSS